MRQTKINLKVVMFALALGLLASASISFACWGNGMGHGPGVVNTQTSLTAEQQQQLDAVKEKYSQQLGELQASLNDKSAAYQKARNKDNTTVGALKDLDAEMAKLELQYWTLLDKGNSEAGQYVAVGNSPWFDCGYNGCNHQNHRGNISQGRHMGPDHRNGMGGRHMAGNCWLN